jgi:hypothetical protein
MAEVVVMKLESVMTTKQGTSGMRETDNLNRILSASHIRERQSQNPNVSASLIIEREIT